MAGCSRPPSASPLGELVHEIGGGTASGRPVKAVQVGGPLGAYIHPSQFDLPFDYEAYAAAGALIGHGGVTVFDDSADMGSMALRHAVLRGGKLRQVHALPDRLDARGRTDRPHPLWRRAPPDAVEALPQMHNARKQAQRATRTSRCSKTCARRCAMPRSARWAASRPIRCVRAEALARGLRVILGCVLAGGQSSRFGSDKALAELGGHTLLARAVDAAFGLVRICRRRGARNRACTDDSRLARARHGAAWRHRRRAASGARRGL
jgi:hypothetical protein